MSKVSDLIDSGHLIPDPNDSTRSIVRIDVSVLNDLIENYNALELAAIGRGWGGLGSTADAVEYLVAWPKRIAAEDVKAKLKEAIVKRELSNFDQQYGGLF